MQRLNEGTLPELLARFLKHRKMPGLQSHASRSRFIEKMMQSQVGLRALTARRFPGTTDPADGSFNPYRCIIEHAHQGRPDEAVWLAFLCIHYGVSESVRLFYGKLGDGTWQWSTVASDPGSVRDWMVKVSVL